MPDEAPTVPTAHPGSGPTAPAGDAGVRRGDRRRRLDRAESGRARLRSLLPTLLPTLVLALGAVALSGLHVSFYSFTSPVDELAHIDYLYKAPSLVRAGETIGQDALREEACRTLPGYPTPPCTPGAVYDPAAFREGGLNTASVYTPLYYTVTKVLATPLTWLPGVDSLVTGARLVGGLWLAAGLVVAAAAARRLGAPRWPTVALLLAAAATPNVILPAASVTPDAAAFLAGALMLWTVVWWETTPRGPGWRFAALAAAALFVVMVKALNIIVVVLVCCYLLLRTLAGLWRARSARAAGRAQDDPAQDDPAQDERSPLSRLSAILVVSLTSVLGAFGFVLYSRTRALPTVVDIPMTAQLLTDDFPTTGLLDHVGVFLEVLYAPGWWVTVPTLGPIVQTTLALVLFAGTFAAALLLPGIDERVRLLGSSLLVVGVVGAPLIIAFSYLSTHVYTPIPGRYALTLIPAAVAVTSAALPTRAARAVVVGAGLLGWGSTVLWLLVH